MGLTVVVVAEALVDTTPLCRVTLISLSTEAKANHLPLKAALEETGQMVTLRWRTQLILVVVVVEQVETLYPAATTVVREIVNQEIIVITETGLRQQDLEMVVLVEKMSIGHRIRRLEQKNIMGVEAVEETTIGLIILMRARSMAVNAA